MTAWQKIKWIASLFGISWPFAAPFILVVLVNLAALGLALLGALAAAAFGWTASGELRDEFAVSVAYFDGMAIWILLFWTIAYAIWQLTRYLMGRQ
jgi:hypothetical protein